MSAVSIASFNWCYLGVSRVTLLLAVLQLLVSSAVFASEYQQLIDSAKKRETSKSTRLDNQSQIQRKDFALDSEGNPIAIPSEPSSALEFTMQDYMQSAEGAALNLSSNQNGSNQELNGQKNQSQKLKSEKPKAKKAKAKKSELKKAKSQKSKYPKNHSSRSGSPKRASKSLSETARSGRTANDPGCRWLNDRIRLLEQFVASKASGQHHQDELSARQSEWHCMDCGGDGPVVGDHARCQYRR